MLTAPISQFAFSRTFCKWNHTACTLPCLASFSITYSEIHPYWCVCLQFIPFGGWEVFHCVWMYHTFLSIHLLMTLGGCHFLNIYLYLLIFLLHILFVARGIFSCSMSNLSCRMLDLIPQSGTELGPQHWECGVLATGPPGKSLPFSSNDKVAINTLVCAFV